MKEYKVYINDTEIDLYDSNDLDLAITLAIADSNDITTRKKANTKTLKFPATGNNKVIFGHPEDPNSIVNIDQQEKPNVVIEADGTEIFRGYIKVQAATNIDDKIIEYEGVCIGTNGDWIQRIGKKKMNELDYSDQNHTNDITAVNGSENIIAGREYVYDLIDRGEFTGQLYDNPPKRGVNIQDRFPALSLTSFVYRIFAAIGYKVVSNFYSSTFFSKLYWCFINEELKHPDAFNANLVCTMQSNTSQKVVVNNTLPIANRSPIGIKLGIPNPAFVSNPSGAFGKAHVGEYFCMGRGKHTFSATIVYTTVAFAYYNAAQTNKGEVLFTFKKINRYKDLNLYAAGYDASSQIYYIPVVNGASNDVATFTKTFDLEFGDEIHVEAQMWFQPQQGNESLNITSYVFQCTKVEGKLGMGENQYVDWAYNLPDVLQLDFIQGLKEAFNLHFYADVNSRTVYFEPRDDFYNGTPIDWSSKLDNRKEIVTTFLGSTLSKIMRYKYKQDSNDKIVETWNKQNGKYFGAEDVDVNNVFAKDDIQEVENTLFAATWMETCPRIGFGSSNIPKMWNDVSLPKRSQKFLPRILFYDGQKTLPNNGYWRMNIKGTIDHQTNNPITNPIAPSGRRSTYPHFYSFDDSQANDNNLMYDDRYYSSGLYEKYFRNAQKILDEGKQFQMSFYLTDTDISNIDFRKPIYVEKNGNGAYYILNKIDNYKSQDRISTVCILTKILPKKLIKALRYKTGFSQIIFVPPSPEVAVAVGLDGSLIASGATYTTRALGGSIMQAGGDVVTNKNNVISSIYFEDVDGKYQKVIMSTNK